MMFMYKQVNPILLNTVKMKGRQIIFLKYVRSHIISKKVSQKSFTDNFSASSQDTFDAFATELGIANECPKLIYKYSLFNPESDLTCFLYGKLSQDPSGFLC